MLLRDYQTPLAAGTGEDGSKGETPCDLLPVGGEEEGVKEGERRRKDTMTKKSLCFSNM